MELLQILAQFNIDPIYIPRSQKESRALLSQHPRMPDMELPMELYKVLRQMAARTKTDEVKEAARISDEDWAFNKLWRMVKQGTGW